MSSFYLGGLCKANLRRRLYRSILLLVALLAVSGAAQRVDEISASPVSLIENISIREFSFNPPSITIDVGDTVQWDNNGGLTHTTTANGGAWNSGFLSPGSSFGHTFNNSGTFPYRCAIHTFMVGTITVQVTVPDVVGLSQAEAEAAIVGSGLTVGSVTTANSDTVPAGNVIGQNPTAGSSVAPGTAVDLEVSLGPALVTVPDVAGLSEAGAEAAIVGSGLTVGDVTTTTSDTVPAGDVISQNLTAGTSVAPGTAVDLVVSLGPALVTVPDVVGLSEAGAEAAIVGSGLTVGGLATATSDTVPAGDVISQNPTAGTSVAPGAAVDLVLSRGTDDDVFCGDVHPAGGGDGDDDILDALRKLKIAVGLVIPDQREMIAGDVHPDNETGPDGDGDIDVLDALRDLKAAVGLVAITSCGGPR